MSSNITSERDAQKTARPSTLRLDLSMEIAETYQELCGRLRAMDSGALIGVEGFCSSGKSTLADRLAVDISAAVIHADEFAAKHETPSIYRLPETLTIS